MTRDAICVFFLPVLTNVTAAPNNGTEGALYHLLKQAPAIAAIDDVSGYGSCAYPSSDDDYEAGANVTDCPCDIAVSKYTHSNFLDE